MLIIQFFPRQNYKQDQEFTRKKISIKLYVKSGKIVILSKKQTNKINQKMKQGLAAIKPTRLQFVPSKRKKVSMHKNSKLFLLLEKSFLLKFKINGLKKKSHVLGNKLLA